MSAETNRQGSTDGNPYAPQVGTWTLTAPDGRQWTGDTPLKVVSTEHHERVPAKVSLRRIFKEADRWCEGIIELKSEGDAIVVSVERNGVYVEVIREYSADPPPIGHAVHPTGIDAALEKAGLL